MKTRILFYFVIFSLCLGTKKAAATTYTWSGLISTSWTNPLNWGVSSGYPGSGAGDIAIFPWISFGSPTLSSNLPNSLSSIQSGDLASVSITVNSGVTLNTGGITTGNNWLGVAGITFLGGGTINISGTTSFTYLGSLTFGSSSGSTQPTVNYAAGSVINYSSNSGIITNYGTLNFNGTSSSGITTNFYYLGSFINSGTINATYTGFLIPNASYTNVTITNTGSFSITSSTIGLTSQPSVLNNSGTFTATSSTFNLSHNNTTISNTKTFTATSSTFNLTGQSAAISNSGSTAAFSLSQSAVNMNSSNTVNITNSTNATFTINNNSTITMSGYRNYISNAGIFKAGTSGSPCVITISGQGASSGNTSMVNTGTFTLGSTSIIYPNGTDSTNPVKITNSSGTFTLQSDINGSAAIGALGAGSSAVGTFNVERYFNGGAVATYRGYRLGSSAVNTNSVTNNTGATALYSLDFLSTSPSSIFTAGPGGTSSGFTSLGAGNSTIYLYREDLSSSGATFNGGNFKGVNAINTGTTFVVANTAGTGSTSTTLPVGNGYMLYYIGDKTLLTSKVTRSGGKFADPESSTSTAIGTINQGDVPVKIWFRTNTFLSYTNAPGVNNYISPSYVRGFNLVGNPYPSAIDWDDFTNGASDPGTGIYGPNLKNSVYVFDYRSKNYGVYQQGTASGLGTRNSSHIIVSGQGFLVKVDSSKTVTAAKLTFHEGAKIYAQNTGNGLLFKSALTTPQVLRIKLSQDAVNADDIILTFESDAENEYEGDKDADYLQGIGSAVSLSSYAFNSNKKLAINHLHSIDESTRIKLYASASSSTILDTLSATGFDSLDPRFDVYLIDHYKKDSLFFSKYKQYLFHVDRNDASSYGSDRFELVFHKNSEYKYHLLGFTAKAAKGGALLTWKVEKESTFTSFTIERNNGDSLYTVQSNGSGIYTYLDKSPLTGVNTYRLKQVDAFGNITYSTATLNFNSQVSTADDFYSIYPNPVITQFNIKINTSAIPKQVQVRVTDLMGNTVINTKNPGDNIRVNAYNLMPGAYIVEVTDSSTKKTLGQKKLIKQ